MKERVNQINNLKKRNVLGITLIALVVTIVVLLILAGVTINMIFSENGIITKAMQVKEESEISYEKEAISLSLLLAKFSNKELKVNEFREALYSHCGEEKVNVNEYRRKI